MKKLRRLRNMAVSMLVLLGLLFGIQNVSYSQAVQPPARPVAIPDPNLAAAIRKEIGNNINTQTLLNLTYLDARNTGIKDLTGIEHAHNLTGLALYENGITDISPIAKLTKLNNLDLWSNNIRDISPIAKLTKLNNLWLRENSITDISPLAKLTKLTLLDLRASSITDISPLAKLTKLNNLWLRESSITDISPLAKLTKLNNLWLRESSITDISPLAKLTKLNNLWLGGSGITDISPIVKLTELNYLSIWYNDISDISPIAKLTELNYLSIRYNDISDISPIAKLTKLNRLELDGSGITDISPIAKLTKLTWLSLYGNSITDISPLVDLDLRGTEWDSTGLDIQGNPLGYVSINTHIPAMQAKGVEIKFDNRTPTTLRSISGNTQEGIVNTTLPLPFVVEVLDEKNWAFAGVPVKFAVVAGGGKLNATTARTDATGKAAAHLKMGRTVGPTTVHVTAAAIPQSVQFTATAVLRSAPVSIADTNLRVKIAAALKKPLGATVTHANMLKLETLTANNANIYELAGLQHASNLTSLSLNKNGISDVEPLAALTELTKLNLRNNRISDISPLTSLAHLQRLDLRGNALTDKTIRAYIPLLQAAGVKVLFDRRALTDSRPIVRLIYFRPRDRQPQPDIDAKMDRLIKDVQKFYADEMERHGFGRKTFQFETDANGNAVVYHINGRFDDRYYHDVSGVAWQEINEQFDSPRSISLTALDVGSEVIGIGDGDPACGTGGGGTYRGTALIPASGGCFIRSATGRKLKHNVAAHELGHAFGLNHDFRGPGYLMSYGQQDELSFCAAEWLSAHRAFNPSRTMQNTAPTFEMLSAKLVSAPNKIHLRFSVTDPDGVHQVQLLKETLSGPAAGQPELIACKHLNQIPSNTINFFTTSLIPANKTVSLNVIDVHGDISWSKAFPVDIASLLPRSKAAPTLLPSELEGLTAADIQHLLTQARQRGLMDPVSLRSIALLEQRLALLLPKETVLLTNYPNPFNPETWIPYQLANAAEVHIAIYDAQGRLVRQLDLGHQAEGYYTEKARAAYWDGRNARGEPVASGLYFYTITAGDFSATRKMLIRK